MWPVLTLCTLLTIGNKERLVRTSELQVEFLTPFRAGWDYRENAREAILDLEWIVLYCRFQGESTHK